MAASVTNPFVYGRVLTPRDAACERPALEKRILDVAQNGGQLALVGERRFGKSTLVERTLAVRKTPLLRWDFHEVLSVEDVVYRSSVRLEAFLAEQSWVARKVAPWFREVGVTLEAIRVGYRGSETSFSARIPTDHLARLLSYLEPLAKRRPFALFIDELQDLKDRLPGRQGDALLGLLRSELQRLSIPVFYAGSGRASFRALFMESRSPFYESAPLLEVPTIPSDDLREFIIEQFRRARKSIDPMLADAIVALGGESPNDVQHLAHEVFAATPGSTVEAASVGLALDKVLADLTPTLSVMWSGLTARQQRVLLTVALAEYLGASTTEFMRLAGVTSHAAVSAALKTLVAGANPLVEKTGSKYRIRHRFVQLWLVRSRGYVEQHIPALRDPDVYAAALARVSPLLTRLLPIPPPGG